MSEKNRMYETAADEIERLRADLAKVTAERDALSQKLCEARFIAQTWHDRWGLHASQEQHEYDAEIIESWCTEGTSG